MAKDSLRLRLTEHIYILAQLDALREVAPPRRFSQIDSDVLPMSDER